MTTGNDQLSGWTENKLQSTSQSQTCTQKRPWSLFGGLLPTGSTTVFGISVKPLHLRHMFIKQMRYTKTATPTADIGQQNGPDSSPWQCLTAQPMCQKLSKSDSEVLPHPPYSSDLWPTNFFKYLDKFLQGKCFYNQQEAENAF